MNYSRSAWLRKSQSSCMTVFVISACDDDLHVGCPIVTPPKLVRTSPAPKRGVLEVLSLKCFTAEAANAGCEVWKGITLAHRLPRSSTE